LRRSGSRICAQSRRFKCAPASAKTVAECNADYAANKTAVKALKWYPNEHGDIHAPFTTIDRKDRVCA